MGNAKGGEELGDTIRILAGPEINVQSVTFYTNNVMHDIIKIE